MAQNEESDFVVVFTVRNDKDRGILIEQLEYNNDIYFFKHHDMSLHRHCDQIQNIVRSVGVQRSKKIRVDTAEFCYEYFVDKVPSFKRCFLNSTKQQMKKVADACINKEIGAKKRSTTVANNKERKIEERKIGILERMKAADDYYQAERKKRMEEFGAAVLKNPVVAQQVRNPPSATVHPLRESQINGQQPVVQSSSSASLPGPTVHPTPWLNIRPSVESMEHDLPDDDDL